MTIDYSFVPDAERARRLDDSMHRRLGESIRHLSVQCKDVVDHDIARIASLASRLDKAERLSPIGFALYYRLLDSVIEERFDESRRHFDALAALTPCDATMLINPLCPAELGPRFEFYSTMMNEADAGAEVAFQSPSTQLFFGFKSRLESGLDLLRRAIPALAGEVSAIIHEIIVVAGDKSKPLQFDGGSHFQLWGSLFLNGEFHHDDIAIVEVLAHEAAHSLLFGYCTDDALVDNDCNELFASPLRPDPRPMDGIYHATFVSARMYWAMQRLLESGLLDASALERARAANVLNKLNFDAGYSVVAEHGRVTPLGQSLMFGASEYMASVAA